MTPKHAGRTEPRNRILTASLHGFALFTILCAGVTFAAPWSYTSNVPCFEGWTTWDVGALRKAAYIHFQMRYLHVDTGEVFYYRDDSEKRYTTMIKSHKIEFCGFGQWNVDLRFSVYDINLGRASWTEWESVKHVSIVADPNALTPDKSVLIEVIT